MQDHVIQAKRVMEHYEIYVDGEFEQSCDVGELSNTLEALREEYENK